MDTDRGRMRPGAYTETEVVYSSSGVFLKQARSTNGTFVNGTKVNEAVLQAHDRVRLGQIELVVRQSTWVRKVVK